MRKDFAINEYEGTEEETENYRKQKEIMERTGNFEECKTEKKCPRCGSTLYLSDLPQYDYVCLECDENFCSAEVNFQKSERGWHKSMICNKTFCVFHKGENNCLIPPDENFFITNGEGVVEHCINGIPSEKELSREGKEKLRKWKKENLA